MFSDPLKAFVAQDSFPCVGAKAALAHDNIRTFAAGDFLDSSDNIAIAQALQNFAAQTTDDSVFISFAVEFTGPDNLSEPDFEMALWHKLQNLHDIDARHYTWDPHVSNDPASPHFSMSFGGKAFYVIGMHPHASRPGRRTDIPTLVFNLHSQFEILRRDGRFQGIQTAVSERDRKFNGSTNPMLSTYGENSEALQYSGRRLESGWTCPFHAKNGSHHDS